MRTLILTSEHVKGPDVVALQHSLKDHGWLQGAVDGEFGPDTSRACIRAKYWLGYPDDKLIGTAGPMLFGLLSGKTKPPKDFAVRVAARKKALTATPLRVKAFKEAEKYVGYTENPAGSNHNQFGIKYGYDYVAWCAEFCTVCYVNVGSVAFKLHERWAYVPYVLHDAMAGINGVQITYSPQMGDLVLFDWQRDGVPDHIGLFEAWISPGIFSTIEGNTSGNDGGSQSNGGMVAHRKANPRYKTNVRAYVHVTK